MTVQFAVGDEPLGIAPGRPVDAWLHARVEHVADLPRGQQDDVAALLDDLGADGNYTPTLVVSRDSEGEYQVRLFDADDPRVETRLPVEFDALPPWLQGPPTGG